MGEHLKKKIASVGRDRTYMRKIFASKCALNVVKISHGNIEERKPANSDNRKLQTLVTTDKIDQSF